MPVPTTAPIILVSFEYRQGLLTLRRSAQVGFELTRRLRFGLDELLNAPRSAGVFLDAVSCSLDLRYPLPEPESRVLSLGWPEPAIGRDIHRFHRAVLPVLVDVFRRLSIKATISQGRP